MTPNLFFENNKIIIYTDGGARGNPGPAAIGVVIGPKEYADYIGEATNNIAEYKAVIFALAKTRQLLGQAKAKQAELEIRLDSELVKKQLSGEYRVKDDKMKLLFIEAHNLKFDFKKVTYIHIPRDKNKIADRLLNEVLDKRI